MPSPVTRRLEACWSAVRRCLFVALFTGPSIFGTPANKAGLEQHYDKFLAHNLARCTTCHLPSENKDPQSLEDFPHNPFGARLKAVRQEGGSEFKTIASRLKHIAREDSDRDGIENEKEILLGSNPGDANEFPKTHVRWAEVKMQFQAFQNAYRWRPFEPVNRPEMPQVRNFEWVSNPIDAFIAAEHEKRCLEPRPRAPKEVLLRRVYLDLIGLLPSVSEQESFLQDESPRSYEHLVNRLLEDPRYGERWARHWMDIWRYSDWGGWSGGNQVRDSQPHIWRWRDWIIESLNDNKSYARMIVEMLAADEIAPEDSNTLRATGYLVRNYKMLSREQWLEDTIKHTGQAFLGVTLGCAKCHDHMFDPISQAEYYQVRAVFEPHQVRTDRIPGELDRAKDGLVRAYDTDTNAITYFLRRGDERRPDTNRVMSPGIIQALGGKFEPTPVTLPNFAAFPDKRPFVISETVAASETELQRSQAALQSSAANKDTAGSQLKYEVAKAKHDALLSVLQAERLEDEGKKSSKAWQEAAKAAATLQRTVAVSEARLKLHETEVAQREARATVLETAREFDEAMGDKETEKEDAARIAKLKKSAEKAKSALTESEKKLEEAGKKFAEAEANAAADAGTSYQPRATEKFPEKSTGRRTAFANWMADNANPLTARVAVNHLWLRHFGHGIVATPSDFGRNGRAPTNPQLLDWLAAEFMAQGWRMKELHRLILNSSTYCMASTSDSKNSSIDPDNLHLWRAPARRMEAELVRDNMLYAAGDLDPAMGGPEIDHKLGLVSKRRSIYLRIGPEKEVEFMKIFDGPSITECYLRRPTVNPQQALALSNSELTLREARRFAQVFWNEKAGNESFVRNSFRRLLTREPSKLEMAACREFLAQQGTQHSPARARENLALVLLNHNDFLTIR